MSFAMTYLICPLPEITVCLQSLFDHQKRQCQPLDISEKLSSEQLKTLRSQGQIAFIDVPGAPSTFLGKWWRGQSDVIIKATSSKTEILFKQLIECLEHNCLHPDTTPWFRQVCREAADTSRQFKLLEPGDRIIVGISGGEDSLTLMHILSFLQKRTAFHFDLFPVFIDLKFETMARQALFDYCSAQNWDLSTVSLDGKSILASHDAENKPCSLCSRLRRGKIHGEADRLNCNKICLGQHLDDLCASFLMSLFRGGGLKTMGPNVPADTATKRLIRPLALTEKSTIHAAARFFGYPAIQSCPYEEQLQATGDRAYTEKLLNDLERQFPFVRNAMKHSMGDVRLQHLLDRTASGIDTNPVA